MRLSITYAYAFSADDPMQPEAIAEANISFKYDSQTYAGKYKGSGFTGEIKLADFVDLETGEFV